MVVSSPWIKRIHEKIHGGSSSLSFLSFVIWPNRRFSSWRTVHVFVTISNSLSLFLYLLFNVSILPYTFKSTLTSLTSSIVSLSQVSVGLREKIKSRMNYTPNLSSLSDRWNGSRSFWIIIETCEITYR